MNYYIASLESLDIGDTVEFLQDIDVSTKACSVVFSWPTVIQEQYDEYSQNMSLLAASDPLVQVHGDRSPVRNYDYIEYYLSIKNIRDWLLEATELPSSILGKPFEEQVSIVQERINTCEAVRDILFQYSCMLLWNITITFEGETIQGVLIPGGIYQNKEGTFSLEVQCDKAGIGKGDIPFVTFRIGVEE